MKNKLTQLAMIACASVAVLLASCAKKDTAASLADEIAEQMNALAEAFSSVEDKQSAEAAAVKIDEIGDAMEGIAKRMEALGEPSEEEKKIFNEKLDNAEKAMQDKMTNLANIAAKDPAALEIVMQAMNKFSERMLQIEKTVDSYNLDKAWVLLAVA